MLTCTLVTHNGFFKLERKKGFSIFSEDKKAKRKRLPVAFSHVYPVITLSLMISVFFLLLAFCQYLV